MTGCYCDYDPVDAYWASRPIARKSHRCDECSRTIQPGERYERVRGIWSGFPAVFKTCVWCLAARDLVTSSLQCFCWSHQSLTEDISNVLQDTKVPGLKMAVGRLAVERKRDK